MNYLIKVENHNGEIVHLKECRFISDCVQFCHQLAKNNPYKDYTVKLLNSAYQQVKVYRILKEKTDQ